MFDSKKGISPLIAAVLLIAFTLTIAMLASDFFTGTISDLTGETSEDTQRISEASNLNLKIVETRHNELNDSLKITVQNTGENISSDIVLTAQCSDHAPYQKTVGGLEKGEVERYTMAVANCDVNHVSAQLNDYPVKVEIQKASIDSVDYLSWRQTLKIDFESVNTSSNNIEFLSSSLQLSQDQFNQEETASGGFSGTKTNLTNTGSYLELETP